MGQVINLFSCPPGIHLIVPVVSDNDEVRTQVVVPLWPYIKKGDRMSVCDCGNKTCRTPLAHNCQKRMAKQGFGAGYPLPPESFEDDSVQLVVVPRVGALPCDDE